MKLQQVSGAALLGVALSVTSSQVAAFEKLVAQQPVKTIEQDEDYGKNRNLNGWGWHQGGEEQYKNNKKPGLISVQSVSDSTDGGGGQTQTTTPTGLPEITYLEKNMSNNQFFHEESSNELSVMIATDETVDGVVNEIRVNEDGRGWRTVAQVPSSRMYEVDVTLSAEKSVDIAVRPCFQTVSSSDSTAECGEAISAGIAYNVPRSEHMGWSDMIEMQVPVYAPNTRITGVDQLLEKGYDMVRDGMNVNAHCFDTPPGENHTSVTRYSTEQDFKLIESHEMAMSMLEKSNTLKGSLTFSGVDFKDNKYKNSLYQQAMNVRDKSLYMGRFRHVNRQLVSRPGHELNLLPQYKQMLIDGHKDSFRSACGDRYISSIDLGKEMYYYIRILKEKSHNYSKEEKEARFELLVKDLLDFNFNSTKKEILLSEFSNYELEIKSVSAGAGVASAVTAHSSLEAFLESLEQFSNVNDSTANYTAVGLTTQDYPIPAELTGSPLNQVFLDYPSILDNIADWSVFHDQVEKRCEIYGSRAEYATSPGMKISNDVGKLWIDGLNRSQYDVCAVVRNTIAKEYSHCLAQRKWDSCLAGPSDSRCTIGSKNCEAYATDINVWTPVTASKTLSAYKGDCAATSDCVETFWEQTCLASPSYVLDYRVNYGERPSDSYDRVAEGVSVNEQKLWYVTQLQTDQFKSNNTHCGKLSATLVSKAWRKNTSEYIGEVTVHGLEFRTQVPYR